MAAFIQSGNPTKEAPLMRIRFAARTLFVLLVVAAAASAADFMLGVGQSRIVKIPDLNDKSILETLGPVQVAELGNGWVKLTGTGSGNGRLSVKSGDREKDYTLTVVTSDPKDAVLQLTELLKGLTSPLSVKVSGGRVIVEGTIRSQADRLLYDEVMEYFPDAIQLVRIEAPAVLVDVSAVLIEVERSSGHDVSLLDIDLGGRLETGASGRQQYEGYPVDWDRFLNWRLDASADLLEALKLDLAKGRARIVARPQVVTTNGERAVLLSGGEIPYSASGFWGSETRFKPYGVRLEVTPQVLPSGEVSMDLLVEASQPGGERSSNIVGRRAELKVAVEKGKSLMVAGLSNSEETHSRGCGFLPFFRSSASLVRKELLVIVTPSAQPILGFDKFEMLKPDDLKK
jgi:pilus assembly protein CpaC